MKPSKLAGTPLHKAMNQPRNKSQVQTNKNYISQNLNYDSPKGQLLIE